MSIKQVQGNSDGSRVSRLHNWRLSWRRSMWCSGGKQAAFFSRSSWWSNSSRPTCLKYHVKELLSGCNRHLTGTIRKHQGPTVLPVRYLHILGGSSKCPLQPRASTPSRLVGAFVHVKIANHLNNRSRTSTDDSFMLQLVYCMYVIICNCNLI